VASFYLMDCIVLQARTLTGGIISVEDEMLRRSQRGGLDHHMSEVPQMNLRQIFVAEPCGVLLELNFRGDPDRC
jgi:hypothetical protein